jgi:AraC-like DNA-binding protein
MDRSLWQKSAIVLPEAVAVFHELRVSVSLRLVDGNWHEVHLVPSVTVFEFAHGVETARWKHNHACITRANRTGQTVAETHAGFCDLYVPVIGRGKTWATLVAGPVCRARPSSVDVVGQWKALTGGQARISDPAFAEYLAATLDTLTLEGRLFKDFESLLALFAQMLNGAPDPDEVARKIATLRARLTAARLAERMWEAASSMVDERTTRVWTSDARGDALKSFGLHRRPSHVVVGLLLGRDGASDPIDAALARDSFQRACADHARRSSGMVSLRIGDYGVAILVDDTASGSRQESRLIEIAERATSLARRFGLRLHGGVSAPDDPQDLPGRYRAALAAAEKALSLGTWIVHASPAQALAPDLLRALGKQLIEVAVASPKRLPIEFERFMSAAATRCGYRLEATKAYLETEFGQIADALSAAGALDEKSVQMLLAGVEQSVSVATTILDLFKAYARAVLDLADAAARPTAARHDRSMHRAEAYIREHLGSALRLKQVARLSGFAPAYFSQLFQRTQGTPFGEYVRRLRVKRAKELLLGTALDLDRVAQMTGLKRRQHLSRVFRRMTGKSAAQFRRPKPK